ncbi:hypothetical protein J5N97_018770 [Dioscorea zingiberensis]|uniref:Uncharacterized protein n=1 Tax=Dioscorea zingiberensis TaxID=325984 RepID=A0A9D5CCX2_9LILI|nr:hypothetical protein J5N97_018770 [Dioscorea zingiberensis]
MEKRDDKEKVVKLEEMEYYGGGESGDQDDCYEIDPIDFFRKCNFCASDEVALVAEKGDVALRDYPHPRHLCGNYPFNKSPHESYCSKCFCYVCQSAAPCKKWRGINGHCHVSGKNNADVCRWVIDC